ncbi:hypothetical protein Tco_1206065 [Tanacetum coccineum]
MSKKRLIDYEIKVITNDLGYKRFRGEKIDDEYERDCKIKIEQLLQDYNGVSQRIKAIRDDDDEYSIQTQEYLKKFSSKAITPDLPIEEPDNSLSMGDEHLNTIPETESDEVIKSGVENLVPTPSDFEGISDDTCDVPVRDDSSTIDALNDNSEILSNSNDDGTSSDDDDFEDVEYVSLEEVNDEKEFDLDDILQIQDVIL